jgi:hypothetical protein
MSTSPVSNASIHQEIQAFNQNRRSDLQQLGQALQSGDLAAAQQAYNALATLGQSGPFSNAEPFHRSDRVSDFNAVGQALQAGELASAQSAFATLQSTFGRHQTQPPVNQEPPATVVTLGPMPPVFQPPTLAPTIEPGSTMPPVFQPPTLPPTIEPGSTMPPVFQPPTLPPTIEPGSTMPPVFQPPTLPPTVEPGGTMPPNFQPPAVGSIHQQMQDFRSSRRDDLTQLSKALQSGDLNGAQQEYNALVALGTSGPFRNAGPFAKPERAQDFAAIGQALQSGDLAAAQQSFATLAETFGKSFEAQA